MPESDPTSQEVRKPSSHGFERTRWSLVASARDGSESALNELLCVYRQPLLVYVRSRGWSPEAAEDALQGFMLALIQRTFLGKVSPQGGRFRSYLLASLDNYLKDVLSANLAKKRGGGRAPISLDETTEDGEPMCQPVSSVSDPAQAYDLAWVQALLEQALQQLRHEGEQAGRNTLVQAVYPILFLQHEDRPYAKLASELGMKEGAIRTAVSRMRGRLRVIIRQLIRDTVASDEDFEDEYGYLMGLLK